MTALALTLLLLASQDVGPQIRAEVARYVAAVNSGDARATTARSRKAGRACSRSWAIFSARWVALP